MGKQKKQNMLKANYGITLIALIVTIIVMLILVSVTISMAINGGLFKNAGDAVGDTQNAIDAEQVLANGKVQIDGVWYNSLDEYLTKDDWTTIYEGNATTTNGQVLLSAKSLFKSGYRYRITTDSEGYSVTIETVAIFIGIEDGIRQYALFGVNNGKVISINSRQDYEEKISSVDSTTTFVVGIYGNEIGSGIVLINSTNDYIITKIEEKYSEEAEEKLFEGEIVLPNITSTFDIGVEIPGFKPDIKKEYGVVFTVDGVEQYRTTITTVATWTGIGNVVFWGDGWNRFCFYNNVAFCVTSEEQEVIINEIYEIGESRTYAEENGFGVLIGDSGKGELVTTPNSEYIVPHTVAGVPVTGVTMDCIRGLPTFDKAFSLSVASDPCSLDVIKVTTTDYNFIFEALLPYYGIYDMSECGDDVEIPEEFLDNGSEGLATIYVSPTVKAKYADYDNVVAK